MRVVTRVNALIGQAEMIACVFLLGLISVVTAIGVFFRYVLDSPLVWTADTGVLALVWLTFVGAGAVYRQNGHVAVTGIVGKLPRRGRLAVVLLTSLAISFAVVVMGRVAVTAALVQAGQEIITLEISRSWYSIPIVWAAISTGLATLIALLEQMFPAPTARSEG